VEGTRNVTNVRLVSNQVAALRLNVSGPPTDVQPIGTIVASFTGTTTADAFQDTSGAPVGVGNLLGIYVNTDGGTTWAEMGGAVVVRESDLYLADNATANATSSSHGLLPKLAGGTTKFLREDGTWQLITASSSTVFRGCHAYHSTTQSLGTSGQYFGVLLDSEEFDTDAFHFTSAAALTGTVSKNGTTTITGSGTSFTTELTVNQVISIPGTTVEYFVVSAIASNTSLTVWASATNTASGQTATRRSECAGIPSGLGGYYLLQASTGFASNATGMRRIGFGQNLTPFSNTVPNVHGGAGAPGNSSGATVPPAMTVISCAAGDLLMFIARQDAGGALNIGDATNAFQASQWSITRMG
jgi:hypothetical protein